MSKKQSKRWSMKDIVVIKKYVGEAKDSGFDQLVGIKNAAIHFGVTVNAVRIRYGRYLKGVDMSNLKKNTTKVAMVRKPRKYTKKPIGDVTNFLAKHGATKEVESFSQKQSMTRELRKMVIDLMDTSGQIKAVSVDLSNKSFTVIY